MPPRPRKTAPAEAAEPDALPVAAAEEVPVEPEAAATDPDPKPEASEQPCPQCFPRGWPAADATSAGCGHGSWQR